MDEPILSVPWNCGGEDCSTGWHLATYWVLDKPEDGCEYSVDEFSEGEHEFCESCPSLDEHDKAWLEYLEYCLETGTDVLKQLCRVHDHIKRKARISILVKTSLLGLIATHARMGRGAWQDIRSVDISNFTYLVNPFNRMERGYTLDYTVKEALESRESDPEYNLTISNKRRSWGWPTKPPIPAGTVISATVVIKAPRSESAIAKDVRREARRAIRDIKREQNRERTAL